MRIYGVAYDNDNSSAKLGERHFSTTDSVLGAAAGTSEFCHWKKLKLFNMEKSWDWEKSWDSWDRSKSWQTSPEITS